MIPALIPIIGGLVGKVIDGVLPDKEAAARAKLEAMSLLQTQYLTELKSASKIIVAEAKSESWLARNWRPITMLMFVFIIANNYILVPWGKALGLLYIPALDIPPDMWTLLTVGIGGYIGSRGVEKSIEKWKEK